MDLLDFDGANLYFDEALDGEVQALLADAADAYGSGKAEDYLLRAYFLAPRNLSVLVALYRFYYYQHRLHDALIVATRALQASGGRLGLPEEWAHLNDLCVGFAASQSMGMLRFYLLALKGAGYLNLRVGDIDTGRRMLAKVLEVDPKDQLGAGALLGVIEQMQVRGEEPERASA
jgi:tetratricopeptide (TPR) repeat protein